MPVHLDQKQHKIEVLPWYTQFPDLYPVEHVELNGENIFDPAKSTSNKATAV